MSAWTSSAVAASLRSRFGPPSDQHRRVEAAKVNNGNLATLATSATLRSPASAASTAFEIDRWLSLLEPDDARIVLARAGGSPWKLTCWRLGISRATADRRWRYALALIAWRLNHPDTPCTLSRRQLLRRARASECETSSSATCAPTGVRSGTTMASAPTGRADS